MALVQCYRLINIILYENILNLVKVVFSWCWVTKKYLLPTFRVIRLQSKTCTKYYRKGNCTWGNVTSTIEEQIASWLNRLILKKEGFIIFLRNLSRLEILLFPQFLFRKVNKKHYQSPNSPKITKTVWRRLNMLEMIISLQITFVYLSLCFSSNPNPCLQFRIYYLVNILTSIHYL